VPARHKIRNVLETALNKIAGNRFHKQESGSHTTNPKKGNQRTLQSGLILLGISFIFLSWGLILHQIDKNKITLIKGLEREQTNLTGVLAENLFQILKQKQAIEQSALKWFSDNQPESMNQITGLLSGNRAFTRIVLYGVSGELFYQSSPPHKGIEDPIDIIGCLQQMAADHRSLIVLSKNGQSQTPWQIPLLFSVKNETEIKGAILLELDMGYLLNLLQDINIGRTGRISINSDNGEELACFERNGLVISHGMPRSQLIFPLHTGSGSGVFTHPDSGSFHLAYKQVRDSPFIITVSQGLDEFFFDFDRYKKKVVLVLSILSCCCLLGVCLLLGMINRNHGYLKALAIAHKKNKTLIVKLEREHKASTLAASFDSLTGLYNRPLFVSLAQKNLSLANRNKYFYAVLFIDLDRFKKINDTLGHRMGDLVLKTVADRLTGCTRESDIVARFGGDEFAIMLTEMSTEQNIAPIAEKIIAAIAQPFKNPGGHQIVTSPSIGIAIYPRDGKTIDSLLRNADAAMYKSKNAGPGRYRFFDTSLDTVSLQKVQLEQRMPSAIAQGEFVLHYQPKIRLNDYRVVGLEALVRWQHPNHPLIYPLEFIDLAKETGLVVDLGKWVLEKACQQWVKWSSDGLNPVPVAVNVSSLELKNKAYATHFFTILDRYGISPNHIEIDITEDALIEADKDTVMDNLTTLFSRGVRISLDDFGNGFSNLGRLRSFPISSLKIDRRVIQEIRKGHIEYPIISSTIILAQKLNMIVIAEGVETNEQLVNLKISGCDQAQGYFFSRPVPERDIREFIILPLRKIAQ
jgi:diguanylate cyclase (GGDEF)-like protein